MRYKGAKSVIALLLFLLCGLASGDQPGGLHIHMLRTVCLKGKEMHLGGLGIVRGSDAKLVAKVSSIAMGRAPWSTEEIVIDRRTIMSRLAANGVKATEVRLTGAKKTIVTRGDVVFATGKLIGIAEAFLKKTRPAQGKAKWRLLRKPEGLRVPDGEDIKLQPRLSVNLPSGYVCVEVVAIGGEKEIGVAKIPFKIIYSKRQLVAVRNIPSGGVITSDNTKIVIVTASSKPSEWTSPYGMISARAVRVGGVVRPSACKPKKPVIVIRRNQAVQMKIQMTGFVIVTTGQALQDGRVGELIKVRNTDSKRVVMATVGFDGTVTPVYNNTTRAIRTAATIRNKR
jgi:flagella basal body P-ring formation protein FlgA